MTGFSMGPALLFCPDAPRIVRAEVEQEFAGRVGVGQKALIQDDATGGGSWRGQVKSISGWYSHRRSMLLEPLQFNDVRTLECILELDAGQPSRGAIVLDRRHAIGAVDGRSEERETAPAHCQRGCGGGPIGGSRWTAARVHD